MSNNENLIKANIKENNKSKEGSNFPKISNNKKIVTAAVITMILVLLLGIMVLMLTSSPSSNYNKAVKLYNEKQYSSAKEIFEKIETYKESKNYVEKCINGISYNTGVELFQLKEYEKAIEAFDKADGFSDANSYIEKANEAIAVKNKVSNLDIDIISLVNEFSKIAVDLVEDHNKYIEKWNKDSELAEEKRSIDIEAAIALLEESIFVDSKKMISKTNDKIKKANNIMTQIEQFETEETKECVSAFKDFGNNLINIMDHYVALYQFNPKSTTEFELLVSRSGELADKFSQSRYDMLKKYGLKEEEINERLTEFVEPKL